MFRFGHLRSIRPFPGTRSRILTAVLLLWVPPAVGALEIADPLRPPAQLLAQPLHGSTKNVTVESAPPLLQATRIGPYGRYAVIDGMIVRVGDQVRDMEVRQIGPAQVRLRNHSDEIVLKSPRNGFNKRPAGN
jgi:hypothetical protein